MGPGHPVHGGDRTILIIRDARNPANTYPLVTRYKLRLRIFSLVNVLGYKAFPEKHWRRIHSTNVLEYLSSSSQTGRNPIYAT